MAQLAIRGHETRGKEVIEILEMLAYEILDRELYGNVSHYGYYIHDNGYISLKHCSLLKNAIFFTLEEFLEKYPFKVGDFVSIPEYESEVRICEMYWDGFEIQYKVYRVDEEEWYTSDELLNYNDNPNRTIKDMDVKLTAIPEITTLNMSAIDYNNGLVGYEIPAGYEFDTVIDNKVVLKPIKPQYPKTYEECCETQEKIIFEFGAMSSRFRLQAENKFTAYAAMVLHFYSNPHLVALYEPEDLAKQDSWLMRTPVEPRLDEIFGGKGSFMKYLREHEEEIKEAIQNVEKII